jgi:hypothetical protein
MEHPVYINHLWNTLYTLIIYGTPCNINHLLNSQQSLVSAHFIHANDGVLMPVSLLLLAEVDAVVQALFVQVPNVESAVDVARDGKGRATKEQV